MGVKAGYKQTAEHIAKRIRFGAEHVHWKGDKVSEKGGRTRALRAFPDGPCVRCSSPNGERHHKDSNTANNTPTNVEMLCRGCHMLKDGRLQRLADLGHARHAQLVESAARAKLARTHCKHGHALSGDNLYVYRNKRICKCCRNTATKKYQEKK